MILIIGVSGVILGGFLTSTVLKKSMDRKRDLVLKDAMEKAEMIKKDKILQAKEKFLQLKSEHEKFVHEKNEEISRSDNRLKQKEAVFNQKIEEIQKKQKEIITAKQTLQTQADIV
ncbi:MAG: Rnase Y domain-containing protein, partial [Bacteroidota bacterium]